MSFIREEGDHIFETLLAFGVKQELFCLFVKIGLRYRLFNYLDLRLLAIISYLIEVLAEVSVRVIELVKLLEILTNLLRLLAIDLSSLRSFQDERQGGNGYFHDFLSVLFFFRLTR